jgi:hypothetical protein
VRDEPRGGQQGVEVPGGVARLLEMVHQLTHQASDISREKEEKREGGRDGERDGEGGRGREVVWRRKDVG